MQILIVRSNSLRRVDVLSKHRQDRARATDRLPGGNGLVECILNCCALPRVDVACLITAGNEDHFRISDNLCHFPLGS